MLCNEILIPNNIIRGIITFFLLLFFVKSNFTLVFLSTILATKVTHIAFYKTCIWVTTLGTD